MPETMNCTELVYTMSATPPQILFQFKKQQYFTFFVLSLQTVVCIGYLQHVSTQTSHILNAVRSNVASGYIISCLFF